jgi:hypothetical protein
MIDGKPGHLSGSPGGDEAEQHEADQAAHQRADEGAQQAAHGHAAELPLRQDGQRRQQGAYRPVEQLGGPGRLDGEREGGEEGGHRAAGQNEGEPEEHLVQKVILPG